MALVNKDGVTVETPVRTPTSGDVLAMAEFMKAYASLPGKSADDADEIVSREMGRVMRLWCSQFGAPDGVK